MKYAHLGPIVIYVTEICIKYCSVAPVQGKMNLDITELSDNRIGKALFVEEYEKVECFKMIFGLIRYHFIELKISRR